MTDAGRVWVVGLGPGNPLHLTLEAREALLAATDLVGYAPYVTRAGEVSPLARRHASDNREELARARHALDLALGGAAVAVVSGGDPGVFAMASAVFEAVEAEPARWRDVPIQVVPGVTAMLAAAARLGAPLGGDFCAISLSDNLKPWSVIERRLDATAQGDFVIAIYNPASSARPAQITAAMARLRERRPADTIVMLAHDIGRATEQVTVTTLADVEVAQIGMRTLVIVGASGTRAFLHCGEQRVFTRRSQDGAP